MTATIGAGEALRHLPWRWAAVYVTGSTTQIGTLTMTSVAAKRWVEILDADPNQPDGWEVARIDLDRA